MRKNSEDRAALHGAEADRERDEEKGAVRKEAVRGDRDIKPPTATVRISTGVTQAYEEALIELCGDRSIDCMVHIDAASMPDGYKAMTVDADSECISYKNDDGAIQYRMLTHAAFGSSMVIGMVCTRDGMIELYYRPASDTASPTDYIKVAEKKLASCIVDPMYAIVSEDKIHIVYNVPSPEALELPPKARMPRVMDPDGTEGIPTMRASGAPNIAEFNLATKRNEKRLPKISPMQAYGIGLASSNGRPVLIVGNVYNRLAHKFEERKWRFRDLLGSQEEQMGFEMPTGVSIVDFVEDVRIGQVPMDGDAELGIGETILDCGTEDSVRFDDDTMYIVEDSASDDEVAGSEAVDATSSEAGCEPKEDGADEADGVA